MPNGVLNNAPGITLQNVEVFGNTSSRNGLVLPVCCQ
jgi:hypothetical protein